MHQIGILAAALLCVHYQVKFYYLGAGLPAASLAESVNALKPTAVLLGVTRLQMNEEQSFDSYLQQFRLGLNVKVDVLVGGNAGLKNDVERQKVQFFPTLHALDDFLSKKFRS